MAKRLFSLGGRLKAVCDMAAGYESLCDIGCDHGLLPVWMAYKGLLKRAAACDINSGPLKAARRNIDAYGVSGIVETRLGAGLSPISPGEFETLVIAGMGGILISEILAEDLAKARAFKRTVLAPHRDEEHLRRFLNANGFTIEDEAIALDGGKHYNIIKVINGDEPTFTDIEAAFGRSLVSRRDELLIKRCEDELATVNERLAAIADKSRAESLLARQRLLVEVLGDIR